MSCGRHWARQCTRQGAPAAGSSRRDVSYIDPGHSRKLFPDNALVPHGPQMQCHRDATGGTQHGNATEMQCDRACSATQHAVPDAVRHSMQCHRCSATDAMPQMHAACSATDAVQHSMQSHRDAVRHSCSATEMPLVRHSMATPCAALQALQQHL